MMLLIATLVLRLHLAVDVPAMTQPAQSALHPTSQPIVVVVPPTSATNPDQSASLYERLQQTEFGQIFEGKKELNWNEIRKPAFWLGSIQNLIETLFAFIPRLLGTLAFLFVFWLIYRGIRRMAVGQMKRDDIDTSIRDMLATLIKWFVMGFGLVIACNQLGIPIVAMLTGVSIIGLAVGFAAQETLANFIAGIVIFLDKPFKVGDWIDIDGTFGQVKRVSFRSTRILDLDGEIIVLPNTKMLANKVSNHTTHPLNRVSINVGISYRSSIDTARSALLKITDGDDRLVVNPKPEVIVSSLGDSSVNLVLRVWIKDESLERRILYDYTEKAKKALDAAGIEIPFPHLQLFVEETKAIEMLSKRSNAA